MDDFTHAPAASLDSSEVPHYFSLSQRIGRLRYFVYILSGMVVSSALLLLIYLFCLILPPELARLLFNVSLVLIKNILMPMIVFVMTIRRLHDIDFKGWWALLVVVPFLSAILLLVPGSAGNNRFGKPPRANGPAVKLAAIFLPLGLFMLFFALRNS
ncbi:MAG TPA: DUF805 domain-containing protein, partial [Rhodocyclaceae bacterium]|nr:DUF805 domain-containing protein [Rhodocyclaceae bacterium]